ncbi:MAG TPA: FAD-dependent oxidoreductase [Candidatus Cybelea sp.]|nr:FAD-dependent oxidoreductase [Candidatus Cybelea sp.]
MTRRQRIAVVGGGISGLGAAYFLDRFHDVTLIEAASRLGGHSNTVDVEFGKARFAVDTGFIVYNERNYPNLTRLLAELGQSTKPSDMSFSVSIGGGRHEWSGQSLAAVFAQPANLLRPRFLRMLGEIVRFNRMALRDLEAGRLEGRTLGSYLRASAYGREFQLDYLLPMGAAIWSAPLSRMLDFPAETFVRFFANHGLLNLGARPQWRTVSGGSREYIRRMMARFRGRVRLGQAVTTIRRHEVGVLVRTADGHERIFDQIVVAAHADQALGMMPDADAEERRVLGGCRFQPNVAVLHCDPRMMPRRRAAWSSWNYIAGDQRDMARNVSVTYWMNRLQKIDRRFPLFVTMNPHVEPDPASTFARFEYDHPLLDAGAVAAQRLLPAIQGRRRTWFCGAWCGQGFHEDGLVSAMTVAAALGAAPAWTDVAQLETLGEPMPIPALAAAGG